MTERIALACAVCASRNYTTSSNRARQSERLETRKYCKTCGVHTWHRETK
ncbi:50S ribosomal protein L33 [Lentibacillus kimchii]|uniref:Large ribosomal subunit protein bL33 n=1 Tax=Lentibacillus kimchii TaxID=1542911 RepID=A0ABW2URV4_9BACI